MRSRWAGLGLMSMVALVLGACGGGGGGGSNSPVPGSSLADQLVAAAAEPANDTATNSSSAFAAVQDAGVPAVVVNSPPQINFTVFSDGEVKTDLAASNLRFAIAKLVPGTGGEPDDWVNYIYRTETASAGVGPGGKPVMASALQANTESAAAERLEFHQEGYYTYTFATDITDPAQTQGVAFEPGRTHRIAIQLSYVNAAGETVLVNPYFDFTIDGDGKSVAVTDPNLTRKMADVSSCNSCHEKLALHGGGRVDVQFCVMCHNPGTTDANSGNVLTLATMVHKIHAGRLLKTRLDEGKGGEQFTIWGFRDSEHDFAEVGFPQDLRNCTKCHSGDNPLTPQGDNWKTAVSKRACLTCHANKAGSDWEASHSVFAGTLVGAGAAATDLTNQQCKDCHRVGSALAPERVHFNQNEEHAARYKMNIEDIRVLQVPTTSLEGQVQVKYFLSDPTDGDAPYQLESDSSRFGSLRLYVAYQNMIGQPTAVTEFSAYNNGGSDARVDAIDGTNDGSNHYTAVITLPANSATAVAAGTARVVTIGQVVEHLLEVKSATDPRPEVVPTETVNVVVQNTFRDFALTGTLNPRRTVVATEKCNQCHGALGTTSGSNTLANAFHSGARNIVQACVMCHDVNRSSTTVMTNGLAMQESYQFKRMIHGIHGSSRRAHPFTHGNPVQGAFGKDGSLPLGGIFLNAYAVRGFAPTLFAAGAAVPAGSSFATVEEMINDAATAAGYTGTPVTIENYAAEVAWPGVGINCNVCHVDNSYKNDLGPLGAVVSERPTGSDPRDYAVISPKAASCTACHDDSTVIAHVTSFGGATFGDKTQQAYLQSPRESCADCHSSGGFKGVDIVHGQD